MTSGKRIVGFMILMILLYAAIVVVTAAQGQAPNRINTVAAVILSHPEVNSCDEDRRGLIVDWAAARLNGSGNQGPWGRKSRARPVGNQAVNPNTDGLTFLRPDGKFEIIDVIAGAPPCGATWDTDGHGFNGGENGWWAPPQSQEPSQGQPGPTPTPGPSPADPEVAKLRQEVTFLLSEVAYVRGQINLLPQLAREVTIQELLKLKPQFDAEVQSSIDEAILRLEVTGSTGRSLGHTHSINLKVRKQ